MYVIDVVTGETTTLLPQMARGIESPTWSPDNEWIAIKVFGDTPETRYQATILLVSTDGSQQAIEIDAVGSVFPIDIDWSLDNWLVVSSLDGVGKKTIHTLDLSPWLEREQSFYKGSTP